MYRFGLPRWLSGKESTCQCRGCRRHGFDPWVGKIPWNRKWQPPLVFLPEKFLGKRPWLATVCGVQRVLPNWAWAHTCACVHAHTHTWINCLPSWSCDWDSWITATAQHYHRVRYHISPTPGKIKIQKLKNDFYCFPAIVKWKNPKSYLYKSGRDCMHSNPFLRVF